MKLDKFISNISGVWILAFALFIIIGGELGANNSASVENETAPSISTSTTTVPTTTQPTITTTVPKTTTTQPTTTTTVPKTTTTQPTTTTTSIAREKFADTNFYSKEEYIEHIMNLQFYPGYRGYEGDRVRNYNHGIDYDCSPSKNVRGCREFNEVFPWIGNLDFSLPRGGGNRAFGSVTITLPVGYNILDFGVDLIACGSKNLSCYDFGYDEVNLSLFDYRYRDMGGLVTYYVDLVGMDTSGTIIKDNNFFYPGNYYFLKSLQLIIFDENDTNPNGRWTGFIIYNVVPEVGTIATQAGWNGPLNLAWVNPSYTFLYASLDEYNNTPYFEP